MPFLNHLPTVLILLALAAVVFLAVRSILRQKKKGSSCGCGCASCPMSGRCHPSEDPEKAE